MGVYWTTRDFKRKLGRDTVTIPAGHRVRIELRDEAEAGLKSGALSKEKPDLPLFDPDDASIDPQKRPVEPKDTPQAVAEIERLAGELGMPYEGARAQVYKRLKPKTDAMVNGLSLGHAIREVRKAQGLLGDEELLADFQDEMERRTDDPPEELEAAAYGVAKQHGINVAQAIRFVRMSYELDADADTLAREHKALTEDGTTTPEEAYADLRERHPADDGAAGEEPGALASAEAEGDDSGPGGELRAGAAVIVEFNGKPTRGEVATVTKTGEVRVNVAGDDASWRKFAIDQVRVLDEDEVY